MLTGQDLVAHLDDQSIATIIQPPVGMIGGGGGLLQDRVARDHFARDQIFADAEMLQRALGLGTPQFFGRDLDNAKTVALFSNIHHLFAPSRAIVPDVFERGSGWFSALRQAGTIVQCGPCGFLSISDHERDFGR